MPVLIICKFDEDPNKLLWCPHFPHNKSIENIFDTHGQITPNRP